MFDIVEQNHLIQITIFGALGLAAIYHIILYYHIRIKLLLYYSIYLLAVFIYSFFRLVYPSTETVWKVLPQIQLDDLLSLFTFVMYIRFLSLALELKFNTEKFAVRFITITYWLIGIYIVVQLFTINLFGWHKINFYIKTSLRLYMLLVGLYFIIALFKKRKGSFYKYLGMGGMLLILLGLVSNIANIIRPEVFLTTPLNWLFLAYLADIVCFSAAMGIYVRNETLEKLAAEMESLKISNTLKKAALEKITEKQRIQAELHDDVGANLSSIRILADLISNGKQQDATLFSNKISNIAKLTSQQMNTIVWALNSDNDSLLNFCEYVRQYAVQFLEGGNINLEYCQNLENEQFALNGDTRKNLFLSIKEVLHNAVKYAQCTTIDISITQTSKEIIICISDNGTGILMQNQFGNGIKNIQNRLSQLNDNANFENDKGLKVTLTCPILFN